MLSRLTRTLIACLTTSWLTSCAGHAPLIQVGSPTGPLVQVGSNQPPATVVNNIVSSACGWDSAFYPGRVNPQPKVGYSKRWTDAEMAWLVKHNQKIDEFCPQKPNK